MRRCEQLLPDDRQLVDLAADRVAQLVRLVDRPLGVARRLRDRGLAVGARTRPDVLGLLGRELQHRGEALGDAGRRRRRRELPATLGERGLRATGPFLGLDRVISHPRDVLVDLVTVVAPERVSEVRRRLLHDAHVVTPRDGWNCPASTRPRCLCLCAHHVTLRR